jgi:hypothetical protein
MPPKSKAKMNTLDLSDQVTVWDLLKGSMFLAEVGQHRGKNESSICRTVLNTMHPEHTRVSSRVVSLEPDDHRYPESPVSLED